MREKPARSEMSRHWSLDPEIVFLNHGSFGACPTAILDRQRDIRDRMEAEPVRFMVRELESLLDESRRILGAFLGADQAGLAFVTNATTGINSVLRSLDLNHGDELITTTHEYNASKNALEFVAQKSGARVVVVEIPFPIRCADEVADRILDAVGPKTRLALLDHVTSQTGLVFPIETIVRSLRDRGVETLVDGAHAPGMLPLDIDSIGAAWYAGNCHKWICAPKGAGFLCARSDMRGTVRPTVISHGANSPRTDRNRYLLEFDWPGTFDPAAWITIGDSISFLGSLVPGGWSEVRSRNRELALEARRALCSALGVEPPSPPEMIGSLVSIPLPDGAATAAPSLYGDPIQDALLDQYSIEVPVVPWPRPPKRLLRISAALYNHIGEYDYLAGALVELLMEEAGAGQR